MKTLHVVSDTISVHYGPYLQLYLSEYYKYSRKEKKIGRLDNPEGPNGRDSYTVLEYLNKALLEGMYWDVLILNCGLHDIRSIDGRCQTDIEDYIKQLKLIFEIIPKISRYAVWIRTTPVADNLHNNLIKDFKRFDVDVQKYNAAADIIAVESGAFLVDLYSFTKFLGGDEIYEDHIHFVENVRKLQAAYIAGQLIGLQGSIS